MDATENIDNSSDYSMYVCGVDTDNNNLIDLANMQGDKINAYMYFVMYKNVAIFVEAYDTTSAENILAELGIPNETTSVESTEAAEDDESGI